MAVLHKKEEKIQAVLGRLSKKYTHEQFVEMFIKLYSKDWGKIKSAYIKQSQDKEPGTIINMPKPDLYLKQVLESYLKQNDTSEMKEAEVLVASVAVLEEKKPTSVSKKPKPTEEAIMAEPKKTKTPAKKKAEPVVETTAVVKKPKAVAKKKVIVEEESTPIIKKVKAAKK